MHLIESPLVGVDEVSINRVSEFRSLKPNLFSPFGVADHKFVGQDILNYYPAIL